MDEKGFLIGVLGRSERVFCRQQWDKKEVRVALQDSSHGSTLPTSLILQSANSRRHGWLTLKLEITTVSSPHLHLDEQRVREKALKKRDNKTFVVMAIIRVSVLAILVVAYPLPLKYRRLFRAAQAAKPESLFSWKNFRTKPRRNEYSTSLQDTDCRWDPSFTWTKTRFQNYPRRVKMQCSSAKNNQAICTSGYDPDSDPRAPWNNTDEWSQGVGVLDMTTVTLKDRYEGSTPPYTAPDIVRRAIENKQQVHLDYTSQEVKNIFENFNSDIPTDSKPADTKANTNTTLIIAIVIPISAIIIIIAMRIALCLRHRRRKQGPQRMRITYSWTSWSIQWNKLCRKKSPGADDPVSHPLGDLVEGERGTQHNNGGRGNQFAGPIGTVFNVLISYTGRKEPARD
ncbi:hypothetical protein BDV95DRAFT_607937 [Massariosphaeria phaeospora]|uniref:Uncharacterized protein n=1 Tax=Massariosphaeria phaeospora TaxID=100035 RepID=A0A7C8I8I5_9PLEO|nr:hypothetical protein BDV95DRAFT_607937 [Massariosphaeria phaeospora]